MNVDMILVTTGGGGGIGGTGHGGQVVDVLCTLVPDRAAAEEGPSC